jgi:hypothetical protein
MNLNYNKVDSLSALIIADDYKNDLNNLSEKRCLSLLKVGNIQIL